MDQGPGFQDGGVDRVSLYRLDKHSLGAERPVRASAR